MFETLQLDFKSAHEDAQMAKSLDGIACIEYGGEHEVGSSREFIRSVSIGQPIRSQADGITCQMGSFKLQSLSPT